jgi:hypothetical protein
MPLLYIHQMAMRKSLPLYCYTSYPQRVSLFISPLPIECDDSPGLKPRGFSGSLRRLNPPSEGKNV